MPQLLSWTVMLTGLDSVSGVSCWLPALCQEKVQRAHLKLLSQSLSLSALLSAAATQVKSQQESECTDTTPTMDASLRVLAHYNRLHTRLTQCLAVVAGKGRWYAKHC